MPHQNMQYQVLYEDCRKSLVVKSEIKIWFAECQKMTLGKSPLCRVSGEDTRQRVNGGGPLPSVLVCRVPPLCRVSVVCRVLSLWHSANSLFVERPIKNTRQSLGTRQRSRLRQCELIKMVWVLLKRDGEGLHTILYIFSPFHKMGIHTLWCVN